VSLRLVAALSLTLGIVGLLSFVHLLGKGPFAPLAARHLRDMKDRTSAPSAYAPMTFADFAALPHHRPVAEYSAIERRGVSLEGYPQHLFRSSDGDLHLELAETPRVTGARDTVYLTGEITPQWQRGSERWRFEPLVAVLRPPGGGVTTWEGGARRLRISGWLMYDVQYDPPVSEWSLAHGAPRLTGWEIHPVTRIEIWSDSLATFVEYPR
jgi:hypothetical protein